MGKINHPNYYRKQDRMECIEEMRQKYGDYFVSVFCYMNAYKYLYRAGDKEGNSRDDDIAKAKWYCKYVQENLLYYQGYLNEDDDLFTLQEDVMAWLNEELRSS